ncbi:hypothetical protein SEA_BILLNYE_175 [Streptomyces phage BillNye]|uniref:Uncharacterized protein n=1 Tax=Streptomyces phage BillNye TaxID=2079426 RepID=A0A2L1IW06_9CAUD|nr:hypothetical protein FDJ30_gp086 [Streptomyces phage BillNye]AVD99347.1 hypothetical protein SEA_BILLNYE_175 [Streptomyces phage BillNye]
MFKKGDKVALKENPLITGTILYVKMGMAYHEYRVLWMNGQELDHRAQSIEHAE